MVKIKEMLYGAAIFLGTFMASYIINGFLDDMINALPFSNSGVKEIIWAFVIIFEVLGMLIMPTVMNIYAITGENKTKNPIINMVIAGLMFVITLIFTIKSWYAITAISTITTNTLLLAMYWIGILIMIFEYGIGIPIYMIINANSEAE